MIQQADDITDKPQRKTPADPRVVEQDPNYRKDSRNPLAAVNQPSLLWHFIYHLFHPPKQGIFILFVRNTLAGNLAVVRVKFYANKVAAHALAGDAGCT